MLVPVGSLCSLTLFWGHMVFTLRIALRSRGCQQLYTPRKYFAPARNFLSFSSCLRSASSSGRGKRQQFQSNSRRRQSSEKRKPDPNKASKTKSTQKKPSKKNKSTRKKNRLRRNRPPPKTPAAKKDRHIFFRLRRKVPSVRGGKNGIYDKQVRQRNTSLRTCFTPWWG